MMTEILTRYRGGITVLATATFLIGLLLNNVTLATNDYSLVLLVASALFVATLLLIVLSWRIQGSGVRIWFAIMALLSVLQLIDSVGRRLL